MFPAHIRISEDIACIQTAEQHSRNTARYAGECLRGVGLEQTGYLSGLLHDCGKFKEEFRRYLSDSNGVRAPSIIPLPAVACYWSDITTSRIIPRRCLLQNCWLLLSAATMGCLTVLTRIVILVFFIG